MSLWATATFGGGLDPQRGLSTSFAPCELMRLMPPLLELAGI
jgi:hypothetical protein